MSRVPSDPAGGEPAWPADQVERWPIEGLKAYANNARLHSEADIDKIAASVDNWGWMIPVVADQDGELIAGHARLRAAIKRKITSVPVIVVRGWSEEKKRAYRLADNQLTARGSWDPEQLSKELRDLKFGEFDLGLIGFEPDQLEKLLRNLGSNGRTDPDSVPERPDRPVSRIGDVWLLGDSRVGCGDSTNAADASQVLRESRPPLMVTDPPYGVDYDPAWRAERNHSVGKLAQGKVLNDDRADWREAYALFPGDVAYVWTGGLRGDVAAASLAASGFQLRAQIIWAKQHFTLNRGDYHWKHEVCWYAVRDGKTSHWQGGRKQTTLWEIPNNNPFGNGQREETWGHGTQKPIECMRRPIANNSRPGQAIYDPFLGSGTSLIAAEMSGRVCYGVELDPAYVDVIVRRWERFTGRDATHQTSGQSFGERADSQDRDQSGCTNA